MPDAKLLPVIAIAEQLKSKPHRVAYVINTRQIEPAQRAGNCRLFDEAAVRRIAVELEQIAHRREVNR